MAPVKERVMAELIETERWLSAPVVAKNLGYSVGYVRTALKELEAEGLVEEAGPGGPFYRVTDSGREQFES